MKNKKPKYELTLKNEGADKPYTVVFILEKDHKGLFRFKDFHIAADFSVVMTASISDKVFRGSEVISDILSNERLDYKSLKKLVSQIRRRMKLPEPTAVMLMEVEIMERRTVIKGVESLYLTPLIKILDKLDKRRPKRSTYGKHARTT